MEGTEEAAGGGVTDAGGEYYGTGRATMGPKQKASWSGSE